MRSSLPIKAIHIPWRKKGKPTATAKGGYHELVKHHKSLLDYHANKAKIHTKAADRPNLSRETKYLHTQIANLHKREIKHHDTKLQHLAGPDWDWLHLHDTSYAAVEDDDSKKSLYVFRPVLNKADIEKWAKSQGFKTPIKDLHVTIAYSSKPLKWSDVGRKTTSLTINGDTRHLRKFDEGAIVLAFSSKKLKSRWNNIKNHGASWDHDDYKPHITLAYELPDPQFNLNNVVPYKGPIKLGPEKMEEIKDKDTRKGDSMKTTAASKRSPPHPLISPDMVDITEHQWKPEFIRHYNSHDAHTHGYNEHSPEGKFGVGPNDTTVHRHGSFKGPIFQVEHKGRVYRSGKIFPLPKINKTTAASKRKGDALRELKRENERNIQSYGTPEHVKHAYELGKQAHASGHKGGMFAHKPFMELHSKVNPNNDMGGGIKIATAWQKGFTDSAAKAPVKTHTPGLPSNKAKANFNPLFDKLPTTASLLPTRSKKGEGPLSPISGQPMVEAFIGNIPVMVDIDNRVVLPVNNEGD